MANDVRRCDVCGTVFKIVEGGYRPYNRIELPIRRSLQSITECTQSDARGYVLMHDYDVCPGCLIAICKTILARRELENG